MLGHTQDGPVEEDILPPRQFGMEACSNFEQTGDTALDPDAARARRSGSAEHLQQRALTRTIFTDDTEDFALGDIEADILQCEDIVTRTFFGSVVHLSHLEQWILLALDTVPPSIQVIFQGACANKAKAILLADIFDVDDGSHNHYTVSMKVFSTRLNTTIPNTRINAMTPKL